MHMQSLCEKTCRGKRESKPRWLSRHVDLRTIRRDLGVIKRAGFRVLSYERARGLKVYRVR